MTFFFLLNLMHAWILDHPHTHMLMRSKTLPLTSWIIIKFLWFTPCPFPMPHTKFAYFLKLLSVFILVLILYSLILQQWHLYHHRSLTFSQFSQQNDWVTLLNVTLNAPGTLELTYILEEHTASIFRTEE
jgi:hypothetical protein